MGRPKGSTNLTTGAKKRSVVAPRKNTFPLVKASDYKVNNIGYGRKPVFKVNYTVGSVSYNENVLLDYWDYGELMALNRDTPECPTTTYTKLNLNAAVGLGLVEGVSLGWANGYKHPVNFMSESLDKYIADSFIRETRNVLKEPITIRKGLTDRAMNWIVPVSRVVDGITDKGYIVFSSDKSVFEYMPLWKYESISKTEPFKLVQNYMDKDGKVKSLKLRLLTEIDSRDFSSKRSSNLSEIFPRIVETNKWGGVVKELNSNKSLVNIARSIMCTMYDFGDVVQAFDRDFGETSEYALGAGLKEHRFYVRNAQIVIRNDTDIVKDTLIVTISGPKGIVWEYTINAPTNMTIYSAMVMGLQYDKMFSTAWEHKGVEKKCESFV